MTAEMGVAVSDVPRLHGSRQRAASELFFAVIALRTVGHDTHLQHMEQAKPCLEDMRSDKNGDGRTVTLVRLKPA